MYSIFNIYNIYSYMYRQQKCVYKALILGFALIDPSTYSLCLEAENTPPENYQFLWSQSLSLQPCSSSQGRLCLEGHTAEWSIMEMARYAPPPRSLLLHYNYKYKYNYYKYTSTICTTTWSLLLQYNYNYKYTQVQVEYAPPPPPNAMLLCRALKVEIYRSTDGFKVECMAEL